MKIFIPFKPDFFSLLAFVFLSFCVERGWAQTTVTFTSSTSWTAPAGVTSVSVECWGGGGAGGGEVLTGVFGGGGGAGGAYATKVVTVVPGNNYTVTVGTGGAGGTGAGPNGNPSWFSIVSEVYAQGGAGGAAPNGGTATGGAGSSASSIGTTKYAGGNGANGTAALSGGGGGGAGSTGAGGNASGITAGTGTSVDGGTGGTGDNTAASESDGLPGSTYGGGGSGAMVSDNSNHNGGDGADGLVKITYANYCTPAPTSVDGTGITNVTINSINNTTGAEAGNYGDYTAQSTNVTQGVTETCNITFSTGFTYETKIWVDWNNDNDFVDAGEEVYVGTSLSANPTTLVASFAVPGGASLGNHRMRIGGADTGPPTPCYTGSWASYEDYTINVVAPTPMVFSSCTTTQLNTTDVAPGANTQEIIGIQIVTTGTTSPLSVTQFTLNASGSTAIADINAANSAKIYYTGNSSIFATTTLFGQNTPTIANFNIAGSQTLSSGTNYFWLVYNIKATATIGDVVDGQCTSLNVGGARTPTVTAPAGSRPIAWIYCTSGATSSSDMDITNISFGTINNTSSTVSLTGTQGTATGTAGMYSNWRTSAVPIPACMQGLTIPFSVTIGGSAYGHRVDVYIDFNQDGDFADAGESTAIFAYANPSLPNTTVSNIPIPIGASPGNTIMRVVCVESSTSTDGCGTYSWGETEDYTINIIAATPMAYSSCTTTQGNISSVLVGSTSQEIIGIQIVTTGVTSPLSASQFTLNANGTTAIADINSANSAKIYYTGSSSTFATTTFFGQNTPTIANFTINGSQTLLNGTNYFWLVYDIKAGATVGNVVDGQCPSLDVGGARTPTVTSPVGSRPIVDQIIIGTGTSTGYYPFYAYFGYSRSASLFTAAEVGSPTIITFLAWKISASATANIPVKIYLKTTAATDLTSDTWANMITGATLVFDATTAFTPTGWKNFDITDFSYCTDNLLVLCEANYGNTGVSPYPSFNYTSTSNNSHETWTADNSPPTGSGSTGTSRPNIQISKVPATVTLPNCATYNSPANGATGISCGLNAILNWTPSVTACNPSTSYDVYFGTAASPPFIGNQTAAFYNPGTLLPSTLYYWKIVPRNSAGVALACATWSFTTGATFYPSQTSPPITDGFENCTDWIVVNGTQTNKWLRGSSTFKTGASSMYINNTGSNNNYNENSASVVHFYKDISFPSGNNDYNLKFFWKGEGEGPSWDYDYLKVFFAPVSITPVAGTEVSSTYELTSNVFNQSGIGIWQFFSIKLPIACGGNETRRLVFSWVNNSSIGTQPPIAIDDIMITTTPRTGTTCANPVNILLPYIKTGETTQCTGDDYNNTSTPCSGNNYVLDNDKVYKALIGAAGCVNVTLSNTIPSSGYIGFQVYNGCPDAGGTCVFYSTTGATSGVLTADVNIPSAGYYYIIVDSWNVASDYVTYDISISTPGGNTPSDLPCNASLLSLGVASSGDNTCTSNSGEPAAPGCWINGAINTVWYKIVLPASRDISIRTTAGSLRNTQIAVYSVTACATPGTFTLAGCNDDAPSCNTGYQNSELTVLNSAAAGATVYIVVDGYQDEIGTFSILVIDGNNGAPLWSNYPIVGQDCGAVTTNTNPVCGQTTSVSNPGNFAFGNTCDFTGTSICLSSGEKSSTWYTININGNGNLQFDIIPNDYGDPNPITGQSNPGYVTGDETDYDFAIWKWESACDGTGDGAFCCTEIAAGTTAATRCDYDGLGVTGLYSATDETAPASYSPDFDYAYENQIAVSNGEIYVLAISNYTNDYASGFSLKFSATSPIAYSTPGASLTWGSNTSTSWISQGNWGGCNPPSCTTNAIVNSIGAQPVISSNAEVKDLSISAGATLTINSNCTLTVCGIFTNSGNLVMAPTATLLFNNGAVAQSINGSLTGANKIGNLVINKTGGGTVTLNADIDIAGSFIIQNTTSVFDATNKIVKLAGNFSTAGAGTLSNFSNIEFNGTIPQTYYNASGTKTWTNVVMNNTGGGITLTGTATSNLVISGVLTLTNGLIYTGNPPLLIMNDGSSVSGGGSSSFVDGPMQKIGGTAFVFPVGDAFNRWARIGISVPTVSSTFQAQYFLTQYTNYSSMCASPTPVLNNGSTLEYWQLNRIAGGDAAVTLYWENAGNSGINSCTGAPNTGDLVVAKFNGTCWENINTVGGSYNGSACTGSSSGSVTSDVITSFSPFSFGSKSSAVNPLPIELLYFTGRNNEKENILEWKTASEYNNDFFTLERSANGYEFSDLAILPGEGNSNEIKSYNYIDEKPLDGKNYYRLKQTDIDGTIKYASNIIVLDWITPTEYKIFPNPSSAEIFIVVSNGREKSVQIEISDVCGRKIMEQKPFAIGLGNAPISVDVSRAW